MSDLRERVERVLNDEVRPALALGDGRLEVLDVDDGVVRVRIGQLCDACPSTILSVLMGLEQELRQRVPEVAYLEAVP